MIHEVPECVFGMKVSFHTINNYIISGEKKLCNRSRQVKTPNVHLIHNTFFICCIDKFLGAVHRFFLNYMSVEKKMKNNKKLNRNLFVL